MKLCRYGVMGAEKPGMIDSEGLLRDLSDYCSDITAAEISPSRLQQLREIDISTLPVVTGNPRIGTPINQASKFIGIGLNYADHAAETGMNPPDEPIIFMKSPSCFSGPHDNIIQPPHSTKLDWEIELGVVIGTKAQFVSADEALDYVAGYCIVNDVSERAFQMQSRQWDKGKGCDTFGPVGPWLVTKDEVPDPQNLNMKLTVNGEVKQLGNTQTMIFSVKQLVSYISQYMTLLPGDIIATGTPPGVGMALKPEPQFLKAGDQLILTITGLGQQAHQVEASQRQIQRWK